MIVGVSIIKVCCPIRSNLQYCEENTSSLSVSERNEPCFEKISAVTASHALFFWIDRFDIFAFDFIAVSPLEIVVVVAVNSLCRDARFPRRVVSIDLLGIEVEIVVVDGVRFELRSSLGFFLIGQLFGTDRNRTERFGALLCQTVTNVFRDRLVRHIVTNTLGGEKPVVGYIGTVRSVRNDKPRQVSDIELSVVPTHTVVMSGPYKLAVCNQKGGVGKSTVTLNTAGALAQAGHDVLVIDLDPNGHLTNALGFDEVYQEDEPTLDGEVRVFSVISCV